MLNDTIVLIVLITGAIASGKTLLAKSLSKRLQLEHFKTREAIRNRFGSDKDRQTLQELGRNLDRDTNGRWLVIELEKVIKDKHVDSFVVDAVRTSGQVHAIRERFSNVCHIHLMAPGSVLRQRFNIRNNADVLDGTYDDAKRCVVEQAVNKLADLADGVIDTGWSSPDRTMEQALVILGERPYESWLV